MIKKGDNVIVIAGKDLGKKGKVSHSLPSQNRLIIEGVNIVKRRERPRRQGQKGQVVEVAAPLHASNVQLWCPNCKKGSRIGVQIGAGKKQRICKKCGKDL